MTAESLAYVFSEAGDEAVIAFDGTADPSTRPRLEEAVERLTEGQTPRSRVDLRHVDFLDSGSVGILVRACNTVRQQGREFEVRGAGPAAARRLRAAGAYHMLGTTRRSAGR